MSNRRTHRRRSSRKNSNRWLAKLLKWQNLKKILIATSVLFTVSAVYVVYLDFQIRSQFEGKRWAIPAKVYARPLELYPQARLNADQFENELQVLAYHRSMNPDRPGSYFRKGNNFRVISRSFTFWDGSEPSITMQVRFIGNTLEDLYDVNSRTPLPIVRFDPAIIGRIYPSHTEDRVLVKLDEVPPLLVKALIAVEDRDFYVHSGVSLRGIARAFIANIRAGSTVQGGSTLTQQLVKNFFLSNERSLWRKVNEAIMALLLEWHYDKNEIMEAYINEIFLGQDGKRSIHGFGLASRFYFEKPLHKLRTDEIALLVGIVKGPSYYSPRRSPERALERRNLVLDMLVGQGEINQAEGESAKGEPLTVVPLEKSNITSYPAFMDLMRRQLRRDYKEEDLNSEGLQIFTTLDPLVQLESEKALSKWLNRLGKSKDMPDSELQGASIVVSVDGGEVLSVVGGRNPQFAGFNRALDAVRPIGSLIKPAVYLTALQQSEKYTLVSLLDDGPLTLELENGDQWQPENFDKEFHGMVPIYKALSNSYNLSTTRLGLEVGLPSIIHTLRLLGVEKEIKPYPSLLLGSLALAPVEVAQMYHTLAAGGFRTPLRAIRDVLTAQGQPLQRYPLSVEKVIDAESVYLLNAALRETTRRGTGQGVYRFVPPDLTVSGKTGTSNDLRDSWFAGYTGDKLGIVWVGMDDNRPAELTGSQGALKVWGEIFQTVNTDSAIDTTPSTIEMVTIDTETQLLASSGCDTALQLPFVKGTAPVEQSGCGGGVMERSSGWLERLFKR
ncbi:MAG: penicillin-binding protein 1B [Gammaproteobacteria bacterium SG8_11]|nr:MAG: penicillin-binding protein 1B [Gammaproteobacteria bacterium SG8_11]